MGTAILSTTLFFPMEMLNVNYSLKIRFTFSPLSLSIEKKYKIITKNLNHFIFLFVNSPDASLFRREVRKNGELIVELVNIAPIRQEDGAITHYLALQEDITEKKRLAQELIVNDKVNFIAGFGVTPSALSVAPLATEAKIPAVVMAAASGSAALASKLPIQCVERQAAPPNTSGYSLSA